MTKENYSFLCGISLSFVFRVSIFTLHFWLPSSRRLNIFHLLFATLQDKLMPIASRSRSSHHRAWANYSWLKLFKVITAEVSIGNAAAQRGFQFQIQQNSILKGCLVYKAGSAHPKQIVEVQLHPVCTNSVKINKWIWWPH